MNRLRIALPTCIIGGYNLLLLAGCAVAGLSFVGLFNEALVKFAMNGILVLSLLPMINCGVGINFGMPVGLSAGLIGLCLSFQLKLQGTAGWLAALGFSVVVAVAFGAVYGMLLNRLKGREEIAGVFTGFAFVPLMNIFWTLAPFTNRQMLYPIGGAGLRPKISLSGYFFQILDGSWVVHLGPLMLPLGLLAFYSVLALGLTLLNRTLIGRSMQALAMNPGFAKLSGVDENGTRIQAVVLSTVIAAIGMCVYTQSYGFIQLYDGATIMTFPAISALLIGGAALRHARVSHAVMGAFLYQMAYLMSVPVANALLIPELAELLRMIITNGVILFAILYENGEVQHEPA